MEEKFLVNFVGVFEFEKPVQNTLIGRSGYFAFRFSIFKIAIFRRC